MPASSRVRLRAHAKINLDLRILGVRPDGYHELRTIFQTIALHDVVTVESRRGAFELDGDAALMPLDRTNLAWRAADLLWRAAGKRGSPSGARIVIDKRIPSQAGLGGGSSDAATALQLANATLDAPRSSDELHRIAAQIGADVPFFLYGGAQLATGDGTELTPVDLPSAYWVVLVMPDCDAKESTGKVYRAFDERAGADGFRQRADSLRLALAATRTPRDLARLPANDLASSSLARELIEVGAFRADVSGAGPTVFGLFESATDADSASASLQRAGRTLVTRPIDADDLPRVAR